MCLLCHAVIVALLLTLSNKHISIETIEVLTTTNFASYIFLFCFCNYLKPVYWRLLYTHKMEWFKPARFKCFITLFLNYVKKMFITCLLIKHNSFSLPVSHTTPFLVEFQLRIFSIKIEVAFTNNVQAENRLHTSKY